MLISPTNWIAEQFSTFWAVQTDPLPKTCTTFSVSNFRTGCNTVRRLVGGRNLPRTPAAPRGEALGTSFGTPLGRWPHPQWPGRSLVPHVPTNLPTKTRVSHVLHAKGEIVQISTQKNGPTTNTSWQHSGYLLDFPSGA